LISHDLHSFIKHKNESNAQSDPINAQSDQINQPNASENLINTLENELFLINEELRVPLLHIANKFLADKI
jgi:hypothetical protein